MDASDAARLTALKQRVVDVIVISPPADSAPAPAQPKEPPINPDKLKFSDSIATPAPDSTK